MSGRQMGAAPAAAAGSGVASSQAALRQLLGLLRDAHAACELHLEVVRRCEAAVMGSALLAAVRRMGLQAEEHGRRLEHIFAALREEPGGGEAAEGAATAARLHALLATQPRSEALDAVLADLLWRSARRGAEQMATLRVLAGAAGLHLAARLLDLTASELAEAVLALDALAVEGGTARMH